MSIFRWREEWNYGIQVPVNCHNLPQFESAKNELERVEKEPFSLPDKYIGINPQTSSDGRHPLSPTKYVHPSTHEITDLPERLLYNGDRLDEIWLQNMNKVSRAVIDRDRLTRLWARNSAAAVVLWPNG